MHERWFALPPEGSGAVACPKTFFMISELSAMSRAIDKIMEEMGDGSDLKRSEVAHAVFVVASESGDFDVAKLARIARLNLVRRNEQSLEGRA